MNCFKHLAIWITLVVSLSYCEVVTGDCDSVKLDLVIILDTSKSVGKENFPLCIEFIKNILKPLPIDPDYVRVALVRYSTDAQIVSYLNDNMNREDKIKDVSLILYIEGTTYTDLALQRVRDEVLTTKNGDRPEVPDLIILVTDGQSSDPSMTVREARMLRNRPNIKIATVGIGRNIDDFELEKIATEKYYILKVDSFAKLDNIIPGLTAVACSECDGGKLDLVVILDTSKSVGKENFPTCIKFIENILKPLHIDSDHVRVALVRYSDEAQVVSYLNDSMKKDEKIKAVSRIKYIEGATFTDLALQTTGNNVLSSDNGDRPDVPDLILLITDGRTTTPALTVREAKRLKQRNNLKIWTLGVGPNINLYELQLIASNINCTVTVDTFSQLTDVIRNLTSVTCSDSHGIISTNPENPKVSNNWTPQYPGHTTQSVARAREETTSTKNDQTLPYYDRTSTGLPRRNPPHQATNAARTSTETRWPIKHAKQPEDRFLPYDNETTPSYKRPLESITKLQTRKNTPAQITPTRAQYDLSTGESKSTYNRNSPIDYRQTAFRNGNSPSLPVSNSVNQSTVAPTNCKKQNAMVSLACQMDKLRKQISRLHNQMGRLIDQMDNVQNQMGNLEKDMSNVRNYTELC